MDPKHFHTTLDQRQADSVKAQQDKLAQEANAKNSQAIIDTIGSATKALIAFHKKNPQEVTVSTPDIEKVVASLESLKPLLTDNKPDDAQTVKAIEKLTKAVGKLPTKYPQTKVNVPDSVTVKNQPDYSEGFASVVEAVKGLELTLNLPEKPEDYSTIVEAINRLEPTISLSDYFAQDIDDIEQGVQYIGFLNPNGAWYIIKNEEALNKLRFKFGVSDYQNNWVLAPTYEYKLLDEAFREVLA